MTDDVRVNELLTGIEPQLVDWIPLAVGELKLASPAYCLFVWYHDFSPQDFTPEFGVATTELRDACLSGRHDGQLGDPGEYAVWCPQQTISAPFPGLPLPGCDCDLIRSAVNECYELLAENHDAEEEVALQPFRAMMHRVARTLNNHNWSGILSVTEEFVVLATDYVGYWITEDLQASVPAEKLALLREKRLIPY